MDQRTDRSYATREDLPSWTADEGFQHPGVFPFARGIHPDMYTTRPWRMRQYAGFGTPEDTNLRWKNLIEKGQDGVSCAFDLPTQVGFDSDDPRAAADAGRLGVAIDTLADFKGLFEGIPLDRTAATFNVNATAPIIYAMLLETAERQGVPFDAITGSLSNDPLIEFVARGLWRVPPAGAMRLMGDTFAYSIERTPGFYPMNLRGTLVYEAGGSAVHEASFALSCAIAYLDELRARDLDMAAVARRFSFLFFSDSDFLYQTAKFRAIRTAWARLIRDRYGVDDASAQKLRFTAAIGNFNLRAQLPELNLVRNTLGSLGAVLGGCQSMLVAGMDEAFEIPSEYSSLLGLYTQQVIALESQVTRTVDPLGGSYYVEQLTGQLIEEIEEMVSDIERRGGAIAGIEEGELQRAIADTAFKAQLEEESGERPVVGVNTPGSPPLSDPDFELHTHDEARMKEHHDRLARVREQRETRPVREALSELAETLEGNTNVIDAIRAAVRAGATVGEITGAFVERYGEFIEPVEV